MGGKLEREFSFFMVASLQQQQLQQLQQQHQHQLQQQQGTS